MSNKQTTIKKSISLEGVGIHTGNKVKLTFMPAPADTGYVFKRIDLRNIPEIEALAKYVVDTQRGTTLEKDGVKLKTVVHVLAALVGLEIDNVYIEINGEEPPIMDGSSKFFVEALETAGIKVLDKIRSEYIVKDVISYVLKKAPKNDREEMIDTLKNYLDLGERIMEDGWQKTVMNFHTVKEEKDNES